MRCHVEDVATKKAVAESNPQATAMAIPEPNVSILPRPPFNHMPTRQIAFHTRMATTIAKGLRFFTTFQSTKLHLTAELSGAAAVV
jgi:hypothetical protein